jgi:hypothetical protein
MKKQPSIQLPLIVSVYSEEYGGDYLRQPTLAERNKMLKRGSKFMAVEDSDSILKTCWSKDLNTCYEVISKGLQQEVKKCLELPANTSEDKIRMILHSYLYVKKFCPFGYDEDQTRKEAKQVLVDYGIAA